MKDSIAADVTRKRTDTFAGDPPSGSPHLVDAATLDIAALPERALGWRSKSNPLKRAVDVFGGIGFVLFFGPLMLLIAVTLKLLYGGSIFYRHLRIGRDNREFYCLKFRTMLPDGDRVLAECLARDPAMAEEWCRCQKLRKDPRVHRIGHLLRKASLDELPQFFNVVLGDMSLVGPRPIVRDEVRYYGQDFRYYVSVRPGITGLWQVSGRNDTSYSERVALDVRYVRERSFAMDLRILLRTAGVMVSGRGAY